MLMNGQYVDVTGTVLTPGNGGQNCLGNGEHAGIECCCDECDFYLCCWDFAEDSCETAEDVEGQKTLK